MNYSIQGGGYTGICRDIFFNNFTILDKCWYSCEDIGFRIVKLIQNDNRNS